MSGLESSVWRRTVGDGTGFDRGDPWVPSGRSLVLETYSVTEAW